MSHSRKPFKISATRRKFIFGGTTALGTMAVIGNQALNSHQVKANENQTLTQPSPIRSANGRFNGKVVLITGATSGMGRTAAELFAREGAKVMFCGRRENLGKQVEATIRNNGGEATYMRADVRDPKQVEAFVKATIQKYGRLDIAYNNAGIGRVPGFGRIHEMTTEHWQELNSTNYDGVFYSMKYELQQMLKQKSGVIINKASTLGLVALPNVGAYVSSKHGVVGLTKAAALEYATQGIRVNAIAPGPIETTFLNQFVNPVDTQLYQQVSNSIANKVPLKRWGQPEEIANVALFLADEEASFLNGHIMVVDGGMAAHEGSAAEDRL
jgi:NAD(P)-dependent dehydrogenase (short-subunit alcohol dehydrogenase family)